MKDVFVSSTVRFVRIEPCPSFKPHANRYRTRARGSVLLGAQRSREQRTVALRQPTAVTRHNRDLAEIGSREQELTRHTEHDPTRVLLAAVGRVAQTSSMDVQRPT